MSKSDSRPQPQSRAQFKMFVPFATRWRDNDQYGHMNNAIYYELFDSAINKFLIDAAILHTAGGTAVFLVASSGCNYFTEVAYPAEVEVGLAVSRIGTSAVTYDLGLFVAGRDTSSATGFVVHVNVGAEAEANGAMPMDAGTRMKFAPLVFQEATL